MLSLKRRMGGLMLGILKILVKIGFHGNRHKIAEKKLLDWMHKNGIGV